MRIQSGIALCLATGLLFSCGGGGGGGGGVNGTPPPVTSITGNVAPPSSPSAAPAIQSVEPTPPSTMLLAPNANPASFPAIAQTLNYTFDPTEPTLLKVSALDFFYALDTGAFVGPLMDPTPFPGDTTLGQPNAINVLTTMGVGLGPSGPASTDTLGGLPAFILSQIIPGGSGSEIAGYVIPYSAVANPGGFTYQTFGSWIAFPDNLPEIEGYFSTGVPTDVAALPVVGSATYAGNVSATMIDAVTRDPFDLIATVNITIDFAARTVAISTTGTTVLSDNANPGTPYTTRPDLDMQGVLVYATGSNTYTGVVNSANGMSGNATGRLYGAGIGAATLTKSAGSPPEIGGTFALMLAGTGAVQGAFGGK